MMAAQQETKKRHSRPATSGRKFIPANGHLTLSCPVSFILCSADMKRLPKRAVTLLNLLQTFTLDIFSLATTLFTLTALQRLKTFFGGLPNEKWKLLSCRFCDSIS